MSRIHVLPVHLQNKIAAGEVIERPASVVKELLENAIDAGSTSIAVDIEKAGRRLIRISDNGSGMGNSDAQNAFQRYATSKIRSEDDLYALHTLGFRGEGLAAIAAVSLVGLATAEQGRIGTCINVSAGTVESVGECAATGTTVEVRDLFYNTPARRKFLKSDSTENYHITDTVTREALVHPSLRFSLRVDGGEVMLTASAGSRRERIMQIFGKEFTDDLIEDVVEAAGMRAEMFVGNPGMTRSTRLSQYVFVNQRPVKDQTISQAIYRAFNGALEKNQHPVFFIFFETDPGHVDCNVHPTKREVRFQDKSVVFRFITDAARRIVLGASLQQSVKTLSEVRSFDYRIGTQPHEESRSAASGLGQQPHMVSDRAETYVPERVPFVSLGETLIAFSDNDGLIIMDYHAAHERVNYERLLDASAAMPAAQLLFPQQVKLQPHEAAVLLENQQLIATMGIDVEDFGAGSVLVRSVPEILTGADMNSLMQDVAGALLLRREEPEPLAGTDETPEPVARRKRSVAAQLACHSSIRGREIPDEYRLAKLKRALEQTRNGDRCPHGRPTVIRLSLDALKKMFRKS
ncbi:MAG TPA: DNA mismatch repair endonuclease MutL [Dissulfurispiraceae bacterium]|nr:DNA mismatch repair endonuclease MutL [Dissulfurispiraceae bacterium]